MATQTAKIETKKLLIDIPLELYQRFLASRIRRECNTDSEGIRAALKKAIESDGLCQEQTTQINSEVS